MVMHMNIMVKRKKHLMKKKNKPYHIKHNYKRFTSSNGYKFWAKDLKDAQDYCKMMSGAIGELIEEEKK